MRSPWLRASVAAVWLRRAVPLRLSVSPGLFLDGQKASESRQELFGAFLVRQMAALLEHGNPGVAQISREAMRILDRYPTVLAAPDHQHRTADRLQEAR